MWKFHYFSITQILCEINFWNSIGAKSAILTQLVALNLDFYEFLHSMNAEIYHVKKFRAPQNGKNCSFRTSTYILKIDFTQNMNDRKIMKFRHYGQ